ncbi:MAG TPA: toxin-antitoxin system YwqK family antitoxin, partial [bacterium]|nr:toxin-antitoxin system YwqK family antitoxin [bacterium]
MKKLSAAAGLFLAAIFVFSGCTVVINERPYTGAQSYTPSSNLGTAQRGTAATTVVVNSNTAEAVKAAPVYVSLKISGDSYHFYRGVNRIAVWNFFADGRITKTGEKIDGIVLIHLPHGKQERVFFENNKRHGAHYEFYKNGRIKAKIQFNKGQRHGRYEEYYENGSIKLKIIYKNNVKTGWQNLYWDNGRVREKTAYVNGQRHGYHRVYDRLGKLTREVLYEKDKEKTKGSFAEIVADKINAEVEEEEKEAARGIREKLEQGMR